MTCCAPGAEIAADLSVEGTRPDDATLRAASRDLGNGKLQLEIAVPDVHCATCISSIESALQKLDLVDAARVNLSTKRVRVTYLSEYEKPSELMQTLSNTGHRAFLLDGVFEDRSDDTMKQLIRALAVAGFAAGNIMLFSVSIWSGADETTRTLFHWISALIAIPAVVYAGRPFFGSAFSALKARRLNMDVPIALAVSLALLMSIFETTIGGEHAYFDASVSLLFFLLIGRTLDYMMRERARGAVKNLSRLAPRNAVQLLADGSREVIAIDDIELGMHIAVTAGERLPVDGKVISGRSELDCALVTGESVPEAITPDTEYLAGSLNLTGAIVLEATQKAEQSFLARMITLMESAEGSRAGYRRIADRAAQIYAPLVHTLAFATLLGWVAFNGDWHHAILTAMAVLIITCPCALALAVPMVHMVASGRLFEAGIMMKDSAALERLSAVTHVVFDKTGTLTEGRPVLQSQFVGGAQEASVAAQMARQSTHPFSKALAAAYVARESAHSQFTEVPGAGVEMVEGDDLWRLGNPEWCNAQQFGQHAGSEVWLSRNGQAVAAFALVDRPRQDAKETIQTLKQRGLTISLLSGDRTQAVELLAQELGIESFEARMTPAKKLDRVQALQDQGAHVLMVGDGINDAPALQLANVSMAPAGAADVGRAAADFVFVRESLLAVDFAINMARRADGAVKQNFGLAISYNCIAIPLAVLGFVTPLIAALAMSLSSIMVTVNALRLRLGQNNPQSEPAPATNRTLKLEPAE